MIHGLFELTISKGACDSPCREAASLNKPYLPMLPPAVFQFPVIARRPRHKQMTTKNSLAVFSLLLVGVGILFPDRAPGSELERPVDKIVIRELVPNGPEVSVLMMKDNQVLLQKPYGLADFPSKRPVTNSTRFDLASISKPVTALIILRLIEKGSFGLDDPVQSIIQDFRVATRGRPVTVRDLLQHSSGLADYTESYSGNDRQIAKINTESHLKWQNKTGAESAPGVKF